MTLSSLEKWRIHLNCGSQGTFSLFNKRRWEFAGESELETYWEYLEKKHFARFVSGELSIQEQRRERIAGVIESLGISPDIDSLDSILAIGNAIAPKPDSRAFAELCEAFRVKPVGACS